MYSTFVGGNALCMSVGPFGCSVQIDSLLIHSLDELTINESKILTIFLLPFILSVLLLLYILKCSNVGYINITILMPSDRIDAFFI